MTAKGPVTGRYAVEVMKVVAVTLVSKHMS